MGNPPAKNHFFHFRRAVIAEQTGLAKCDPEEVVCWLDKGNGNGNGREEKCFG